MAKAGYNLNWVTGSLAVGSAPMSHEQLDAIKAQGVSAILNLCAEFCDLHWIQSEAGFEVYYLPIPDEEAPDLSEMEKALDWLDEVLYLGKKALIHCRHGIGRTGTVVNAYLLRKGLGPKLAKRSLKGLSSQPANFSQWWFLRKYSRQEGRLTIREPSLESGNLVDLFPFFADYEKLVASVDEKLADRQDLCGRDHDRCCRNPVFPGLAEAVFVRHALNSQLSRTDRLAVTGRAVEAASRARTAEREAGAKSAAQRREAYLAADILCPLSEYGECLIFPARPLDCRLFDLGGDAADGLRAELVPALKELSRELFLAYAGAFPENGEMRFSLNDVLSGKFVQVFFHRLMKMERGGPD